MLIKSINKEYRRFELLLIDLQSKGKTIYNIFLFFLRKAYILIIPVKKNIYKGYEL